MNRRQLVFVVLLNSFISLVIAVVVVWVAENRRPDLEELAAQYTPAPPIVLIATQEAITPDPQSGGQPATPTAPADGQGTVTAATPVATPASSQIYVVEAGDSLFGIALQFNLTVDQLMAANNLTDPDFVFSGQRLVIPAATTGSNPANPPANSGANSGSSSPAATLQLRIEQPGNLAEESVLIVNESDNPVNLQGWSITGEVSDPVYVFQDLPLFPGGSVRLHSESGQNDSLNLYWGRSEPVWQSGATVRLFNQNGTQVATLPVP